MSGEYGRTKIHAKELYEGARRNGLLFICELGFGKGVCDSCFIGHDGFVQYSLGSDITFCPYFGWLLYVVYVCEILM